mgnify:CR=1 FL=1
MKRHSGSLIGILRTLPSVRTGAEVGVWTGENSLELLKTFPELELSMVDDYRSESTDEGNNRLQSKTQVDFDEAKRVAQANTEQYKHRRFIIHKSSVRAAKSYQYHGLDFVFLDADHSYESVRRDLNAWHSRVRVGGIMCGHDYNGRGDRSGRFGVKRAVDEFFAGRTIGEEPGLVWWVRVKEMAACPTK